ncbi:MAG: hypothetical protein NC221_03250 [Duncaniella sp.]|nr:hypothetical protein [Muribaculum sp.]MCM1255117.1 hypothetical protein [Duncaniella sp.]
MKQKIFSPLIIVVLVMGMLMSSCSKKGELLDTIPANINAVALMDVKEILKDAGCTFSEEGMLLPQSLKGTKAEDGGLQTLGKLCGTNACDMSNVAVVVCGKQDIVCTFLINDNDKFKELTSSLGWKDGENGYEEGRISGTPVISDGHQAWIMIGGNPYELLKSLLDDAEKEPITKLPGIKAALESDNLLNFALSSMSFGSTDNNVAQQENVWNVLSANIVDNKIVASAQSIKGDGEQVKVKGMQPINPAVLSYVPGNFNFALAGGLTTEFDWKSVMGALSPLFASNFQMQGAMAMLTPFLQSLDGTVLLAAGPANDEAYEDMTPFNWQFMLMAHMPQARINQVMTMIKSMMFQNGISPISEKDGVMVIPQYGMQFYIGNVDGYLAIANIPFDNTRQNSLAPIMVNKEAALCVELPSLNNLIPYGPEYGIKLTADMQGSEGKAELLLPGATHPILETILASIYGE